MFLRSAIRSGRNDRFDIFDSDDEYSEEPEDEDPLCAQGKSAVNKELKGLIPPFRKAMLCAICKRDGSDALGTPENGWRDGYVQPAGNFSDNVKKGGYGVCMQEPYCVMHSTGDQIKYKE